MPKLYETDLYTFLMLFSLNIDYILTAIKLLLIILSSNINLDALLIWKEILHLPFVSQFNLNLEESLGLLNFLYKRVPEPEKLRRCLKCVT